MHTNKQAKVAALEAVHREIVRAFADQLRADMQCVPNIEALLEMGEQRAKQRKAKPASTDSAADSKQPAAASAAEADTEQSAAAALSAEEEKKLRMKKEKGRRNQALEKM